MIERKAEQSARGMANVIAFDTRAAAGKPRIVRWVAEWLRALRAAGGRPVECDIRRYRHLTCYSDRRPEGMVPKRKYRSQKFGCG
jgi:hypothetical protein